MSLYGQRLGGVLIKNLLIAGSQWVLIKDRLSASCAAVVPNYALCITNYALIYADKKGS